MSETGELIYSGEGCPKGKNGENHYIVSEGHKSFCYMCLKPWAGLNAVRAETPERDAHYPTAWAYEQACRALEAAKTERDVLQREADAWAPNWNAMQSRLDKAALLLDKAKEFAELVERDTRTIGSEWGMPHLAVKARALIAEINAKEANVMAECNGLCQWRHQAALDSGSYPDYPAPDCPKHGSRSVQRRVAAQEGRPAPDFSEHGQGGGVSVRKSEDTPPPPTSEDRVALAGAFWEMGEPLTDEVNNTRAYLRQKFGRDDIPPPKVGWDAAT